MAIHIGVKVWSQNLSYIPHIKELYKNGHCDFVEIYVRRHSTQEEASHWQDLGIPVGLHAPHSDGGFNPADSRDIESKIEALHRVEIFRHLLKPVNIVFHPGLDGPLQETIRQFQLFKQQFPEIFKVSLIENKPHVGLKQQVCRGDTAQEIQELMQAVGFGFCLDFGHAASYAAWAQKDWREVIRDFMKLAPRLFHLSDGDIHSVVDMHLHFGKGNFPLEEMLAFLPREAFLTLETPHGSMDNLNDFPKDSKVVRSFVNHD